MATNGKKASKNTKDRKLTYRLTEFLHVPLTDKELLTRADQLARCEKTLEELKQELSKASSHLKGQIKGVEKDRARLSLVVAEKKEQRDVGVEEWIDYKAGELQRIRTDTKEVIYRRKLEVAEKQQTLPIKVAEAKAKPVTDKPPAEVTVGAGMGGDLKPLVVEDAKPAADITKKRKKMPKAEDVQDIHRGGLARSGPHQPTEEPPRAARKAEAAAQPKAE